MIDMAHASSPVQATVEHRAERSRRITLIQYTPAKAAVDRKRVDTSSHIHEAVIMNIASETFELFTFHWDCGVGSSFLENLWSESGAFDHQKLHQTR
jgi:hypothetical protein